MNLFEDIKFQDIILIIFFIIIIYLIYKVNTNNSENFDVTTTKANLTTLSDDIGNIGNIVDKIYEANGNFEIKHNNISITDLIVDGNVTFTNKNTMIMDIFPQYMVIPWASPDVSIYPSGWAICDGNYPTPDLRGRFIYGGTSTNIGGGEETHTLENNEMPTHIHDFQFVYESSWATTNNTSWFTGDPWYGSGWQLFISGSTTVLDSNRLTYYPPNQFSNGTYSTSTSTSTSTYSPHNNMPPYCVLVYIMKLN